MGVLQLGQVAVCHLWEQARLAKHGDPTLALTWKAEWDETRATQPDPSKSPNSPKFFHHPTPRNHDELEGTLEGGARSLYLHVIEGMPQVQGCGLGGDPGPGRGRGPGRVYGRQVGGWGWETRWVCSGRTVWRHLRGLGMGTGATTEPRTQPGPTPGPSPDIQGCGRLCSSASSRLVVWGCLCAEWGRCPICPTPPQP